MIEVGDDDNLAISTKIPSPLPNQISTKFRVRGIVRQMERFRRRVPFPLNCSPWIFRTFLASMKTQNSNIETDRR